MVQCTRVTGPMAKQMEREDSFMPMEMSMMVFGKMTKPMDMVFILTWMEQDTKVNGLKINSTERD